MVRILSKMSKKAIIGILITVVFFFGFWNTGISYGADNPDVTLYIQGEQSRGGPMFASEGDMGKGLWAPGVTRSGTMRIYNNYSQGVHVDNLSLSMKLEKPDGNGYKEVEDESLIDLFAKNMKLKIKKGRLLLFEATIYDNSFLEMMYKQGSPKYKGYEFPLLDRFTIGSGSDTDLQYTVSMDENAGNELQGLKATVSFIINASENAENPPANNSGNNNTQIEFEEEPGEIIPDMPDIKRHWAHDCITELVKNKIIGGYKDGTIRPQNNITRAETAILVARALKLPNMKDKASPYLDKLPDAAKGYIISATEKGVFGGYITEFKPNRIITREEMAVVLARAFDLKPKKDIKLEFKDSRDIAKWALEGVGACVDKGIILGYPNKTFKPGNQITRAEAFTMICRALGYHAQHED